MNYSPAVAVGLGVAAAIALFAPVVLALVLRRKLHASWKAWLIGAATFFVFQVVLRLPWQIPLGLWLKPRMAAEPWIAWAWLVASAFSAGLFEETGRYVAYRFAWKDRSAVGGLMLGAGHGGFESIVLVGLSLAGNTVAYVLLGHGTTLGIPADKLPLVYEQFAKLTPLDALAGGVERLSSIAFHCGLSLLVLQAFRRGSKWWVLLAMAFHGVANLAGVWAAKELGPWPAEAIIGVFAVAAIAWVVHCVREDRASLGDGVLA